MGVVGRSDGAGMKSEIWRYGGVGNSPEEDLALAPSVLLDPEGVEGEGEVATTFTHIVGVLDLVLGEGVVVGCVCLVFFRRILVSMWALIILRTSSSLNSVAIGLEYFGIG